MLFESAHVRVTAEHGTAALWLAFPGEPVNALDLTRLRELDAALAAIEANPFVRILVVRSAKPAGFCAGVHSEALASLTTEADRAAFAWSGQRVLDRLAGLDAVTVALLDGPCLGAGLELALACDYRLCVARPTTHLGFPDAPRGVPPCFGGTVRLPHLVGRQTAAGILTSGRTLSGREAKQLGLVDHAFCERRAKIELQTFLDRLELRPRKRHTPADAGFAAERRAFARSLDAAAVARRLDALRTLVIDPPPLNPVPPSPAVVGLLGDDDTAARIAADAALRGSEVVIAGSGEGVFGGIAIALARGFVTPLEAEQSRSRVKLSPALDGFERAGLVFAAAGEPLDRLAAVIRPRCVVAIGGNYPAWFPHPRRLVGLRFSSPSAAELLRGPRTDADTLAALAAWLRPFGFRSAVAPSLGVSARAA
jgi:enoyl-CoA hydratase/carnithine racemase